jgi:hypothetical protein
MERTQIKYSAKDDTRTVLEPIYETITRCRACHASDLEPVLDLGEQFIPRFVAEIDYGLPRAPLQLVRCIPCGLLQLQHTVKNDLMFRKYWYRSSINQTMKDALTDVVDRATQYHRFGAWLDIGANDGFLLSQVPETFAKTACEPALDFLEPLSKHAQTVVPEYFSKAACPGPYDVITSCAMFYDLDEPEKFVRDIHDVLSPDGIWINQLSDSPTMLEKNDFAAVCHEHLTYYDVHVLADLYRRCGLTITRVTHNDVNGGSVRVIARKSTRAREDLVGIKKPTREDCQTFAKRALKWKERMLDLCHGPFAQRGCWIYGASTKMTVMLQYLDSHDSFIGVAERNPLKYNLRMVGSWLPIVSEDAMRENQPGYILVGPWSFRDEFLRRERATLDAGSTFVFPLPNIELVL